MLSPENIDDTKKLANDFLAKGRGFFGQKLAQFKKKDEISQEDAIVASIQRFIRSGGNDVLTGKQTLALLSKTIRHVNARCREAQRRQHRGSSPEKGDEEGAAADESGLEEIMAFFAKLGRIKFKKDEDVAEGDEMSELNLELFPQIRTLEIQGIQVIHVKGGEQLSHVIIADGASIDVQTPVFASCTDLEVIAAAVDPTIWSLSGTLYSLKVMRCPDFSPAMLCTPPEGKAPVTRLTKLECQECSMKAIPPEMECFDRTTILNLARNEIETLAPLATLPSLTVLDLSYNNIMDLQVFQEGGLACEASLARLTLTGNPIMSTVGLGPWLRNLEALDLADCNLQDWTHEVARLGGLPALRSLRLTGNPIYTNPNNPKDPRLMVVECLAQCSNPADFLLDDVKLSRSELSRWQEEKEDKEAFPEPVVSSPVLTTPDTDLQWPEAERAELLEVQKVRRHRSKKQLHGSGGEEPVSPRSPDGKKKLVVKKVKKRTQDKEVQKGGTVVDASTQTTLPHGLDAGYQQLLLQKVRKRLQTSTYRSLVCDDFTRWSNGLALCALLHSCCGTWIDYHNLLPSKGPDNLRRALEVAEVKLRVPQPSAGVDFVNDPREVAAYVGVLLLSIQEWEGSQYSQSKGLIERLKGEIERYRSQRAKDRRRLGGVSDTTALANPPEAEEEDSDSTEDTLGQTA